MKQNPLSNALIYLINKTAFRLLGGNSRVLSRLSAKYVVGYLHSQNMVDKNNLNEESVKKAFIEDLGSADDFIYSENDGVGVLEIVNPVLRDSIVKLNEENIPISVSPGIIYVYLINDMRNRKVSFQKVVYDKENNKTLWTFKIMS